MKKKLQITCINKPDRMNPHESISYVTCKTLDGWRRKLTLQEAINQIESGEAEFYVSEADKTAKVVIGVSANGHKYLKTVADGAQPDNLLSLPECGCCLS